jgi:hypothetical protein
MGCSVFALRAMQNVQTPETVACNARELHATPLQESPLISQFEILIHIPKSEIQTRLRPNLPRSFDGFPGFRRFGDRQRKVVVLAGFGQTVERFSVLQIMRH